MRSFRPFAALMAISVSGCSIYPTVDEWTGKDTYEVVRDIRCEAREAVAAELLGIVLDLYADKMAYKGLSGRQFYEKIHSGDIHVWEINWNLLNPKLQSNWIYYIRSTVSYDFTLQVEEQNNQDAIFDVTATKFGSASKLPFSLNNDHTRNVERNFFVFDTWSDLFRSKALHDYCSKVPSLPTLPNYQYPVAGRLKIAELIKQFVNLNQSGNLSNKTGVDDSGNLKSAVVPTMSDTLTFTTKIAANADPAAIINPTLGHYMLTDLSLKFDNSRQDLDKVIIVVSLPPEKGGFVSAKNTLGATAASNLSPRALSAEETSRQRDNSARNALIELGSGASRLFP